MKRFGHWMVMTAAALLSAAVVIGCSGGTTEEETESETSAHLTIETAQESDTEAETETETELETQEEADDGLEEGQMYSYLTGEVVDEEIGTLRPVAVMINNIEDAIPQQAGTADADILYELIVEGSITRLMAVYQDLSDVERIGSVRSARHYYIDFANDFDAIYCHYGQSTYAASRISSEGLLTINANVSGAYYQDSNYSSPHHIFTSGARLEAAIATIGADRYLDEDYESAFLFNTEDTELSYGVVANYVSIPFALSAPYLIYDEESGLYYKYQYGAAHTDANSGEQLTFKNILVQYTTYQTISGDSKGRQEVTVTGSGTALYITDGKAVTVTWVKNSTSDKTRYYYEDGTQVVMNQGKTYIAVVPTSYDITLSE